jgi:hypothetical protein
MLYILCTSAVTVGSGFLIAITYFIGMVHFGYYAHKNLQKKIAPASIYGELPPE